MTTEVNVALDPYLSRKKALANELLVNRGPVKESMLKAGYTEAMAKNPAQTLNSLSFQAILNDMLPDSFLLSRHKQLVATDNEAVSLNAVKLGYQVKGKLQPEQSGVTNVNISFGGAPVSYQTQDGTVIDISDKYVQDKEEDSPQEITH